MRRESTKTRSIVVLYRASVFSVRLNRNNARASECFAPPHGPPLRRRRFVFSTSRSARPALLRASENEKNGQECFDTRFFSVIITRLRATSCKFNVWPAVYANKKLARFYLPCPWFYCVRDERACCAKFEILILLGGNSWTSTSC